MCISSTTIHVLQGSSSSFQPYIETLPQQHDCIICWSKGQLSELQGVHGLMHPVCSVVYGIDSSIQHARMLTLHSLCIGLNSCHAVCISESRYLRKDPNHYTSCSLHCSLRTPLLKHDLLQELLLRLGVTAPRLCFSESFYPSCRTGRICGLQMCNPWRRLNCMLAWYSHVPFIC